MGSSRNLLARRRIEYLGHGAGEPSSPAGMPMRFRSATHSVKGAYFILGFALSAYLGIPVTGIAVIALALALMIFQNVQGQPSTEIEEDIL